MISIDTDEVNTQVGIEIIGVSRLMNKFNLNSKDLVIDIVTNTEKVLETV